MINDLIQGIDHIALQVPDLEEGLEFFRDILGFKLVREFEFEGFHCVNLKAGRIEIEMWAGKEERETKLKYDAYGVHHFAVIVKDLNSVVEYFQQSDYPVLEEIYEPTRGIREAIVQAPGGIRVQFVEQNIPLLIWRSIKGDFNDKAASKK